MRLQHTWLLIIGAITLGACLADVNVPGPGYKCSTDADCGSFGPCVAKVCSGGDAGHTGGGVGGGSSGGGVGGGPAGGGVGGGGGSTGGGVGGGSTGGGVGGGSTGGGVGGGSTGGGSGGGGGGTIDAGLPWWNSAYAHRYPLTITNVAPTPISATFSFGWQLDVDALVDGGSTDQVRIVRWNGSSWTELARVVDNLGPHQQWFWIPLEVVLDAGESDSNDYVYFDNPGASAIASNPTAVFRFYDPMTAPLTAVWQYDGGTFMGSTLDLAYGETIRSVAPHGVDEAVDFIAEQVGTNNGRWWGGYQVTGTWADDAPWMIWITRNPGSGFIWPEFTNTGSPVLDGGLEPGVTLNHIYGIDRGKSELLWRFDDAVVDDMPLGAYPTQLLLRFTNESTNVLSIAMVRARETVVPYPTVTNGAIEP